MGFRENSKLMRATLLGRGYVIELADKDDQSVVQTSSYSSLITPWPYLAPPRHEPLPIQAVSYTDFILTFHLLSVPFTISPGNCPPTTLKERGY
jgi:hypothetical protein